MSSTAPDNPASLVSLADRVACLSRPEIYPDPPQRVEAIETHMAWVFLSEHCAWKLKKPVRTRHLDFRTIADRLRDCLLEVELNQQLAPGVYLGVVPLTIDAARQLHLGSQTQRSEGEVVDWLVQMRRLPRELMLDARIAAGTLTVVDVERAAAMLSRFYVQAPPCGLSGAQYVTRLQSELDENRRELLEGGFEVAAREAAARLDSQADFLKRHAPWFDERVARGRVIDTHGDLRPEHICLTPQPVVIDRLEFQRDLRIHDCAAELAFLALECERLGASWVGDIVFAAYADAAEDRPRPELLVFYRNWHACTRARLALLHLRDDVPRTPMKWVNRARWYINHGASGAT